MPNWTESMEQTFEFYVVDPNTWKDVRRLDNVISATINRDSSVETLGSATFDITESVGECYIRTYLVTVQNGIKEKHPLCTFLVQTPSSTFDGRLRSVTMDAYTPLLELKEKYPEMGHFIPKNTNILNAAYDLIKLNSISVPSDATSTQETTNYPYMRAPVIHEESVDSNLVLKSNFISDPNETVLQYVTNLLSVYDYKLDLDEKGQVSFRKDQRSDRLQPRWTYDDSNSSILYPEISMNHDLYGIPNKVIVVYSNNNGVPCVGIAENNDENSPTSIPRRGRVIIHRETNPNFVGAASDAEAKEYAEELLKKLSTVEYTITYTHGYTPVRVGDCVRLNYERAGITDVKAKVISQSITCEPGCPVSETAVYTKKLWR